jgi:hypothetical protein
VDTSSRQGRGGVIDCRPDIPALNSLALRSLVSLFDEKEQLFHRSIALTNKGFRREATSRRRSIIVLLGLQRLLESGESQPLDVELIRDAILKDGSWIKSAEDLGLLTWFIAVCAPEQLEKLFNEYDFGGALAKYSDGRHASTIGMAWFLAGIAHARLRCAEGLPDLTDVAVDTYHLLQENQGEDGIFGHAISSGLLRRAFDNRCGTFSDQIYSIYALSIFARAFQIEEPLGPALDCANSICELQGEMGQWWFRYDKQKCRVINRYPVFSVHQYGTAPTGLFALGEATGQSFHESIYKGLSWIMGANELGNDLRNLDGAVIWDSIGPKRQTTKWWERACSFMNISSGPQSDNLQIRYEVRSDHLGWLLYAFGKFGLSREALSAHTAKA